MQIQIEMLGVYGLWQNEEERIILGVCLRLFTFRLGLLNGGKKRIGDVSGLIGDIGKC